MRNLSMSPTHARGATSRPFARRRLIPSALAVLALGAGGVAMAGQADARVLPTAPVTAVKGAVTMPSGMVECRGEWHITVPVKTTRSDAHGHHHASLWLQTTRTGRAKLIGYDKSTTATVRVVACINSAAVQGGSGPIVVMAEDSLDGNTRPVRVIIPGVTR